MARNQKRAETARSSSRADEIGCGGDGAESCSDGFGFGECDEKGKGLKKEDGSNVTGACSTLNSF